MSNKNSKESGTIVISIVIEKMNAKRNLSLKESVTIATSKDTNLQSVRPRNGNQQNEFVKAIFVWDYYTWCKCHYYGEFGHIGANCIKHHTRKRDTTKRCFVCTEIGHLAKNYINQGRGYVQDHGVPKSGNLK